MKILYLFFTIFLLCLTLLVISLHEHISFVEGYDKSKLIKIGSNDIIHDQSKSHNELFGSTLRNQQSEILNDQSILIDIGSEKPISTIDITWNNSSNIQYNFTLTIISDNKTSKKQFNYLSDILSDNITQTAGTNNTLGRIIILTINSPPSIKSFQSIETISIHTINNKLPSVITNKEHWKKLSHNYPENIKIVNPNGSVIADLYRITDGDDIDITNPNFSFHRFMNISYDRSFYLILPIEHVEGVTATIDSTQYPITINLLNKSIDKNDIVKGKRVYFNIDSHIDDKSNRFENLTFMLAPSSETSIYYKAKIKTN